MESASKKAAEAIEKILGRKIDYADESETSEDELNDEDSEDDSDDDLDNDSDDDFDLVDLFRNPEKIIEGLCFLGEVIQDTSEKICDALDESVERVMEHDFDD